MDELLDEPSRSGAAPTAPQVTAASLTGTAVRGVAWQGLSFVAGKGTLLVATVVLARLLLPPEYGLVTLALVFIGYVDVIADLGVSQALVFLPATRRRSDAALVASVVSAAALAAALSALAPAIAGLLGNREAAPLLRVLPVTLLLGAIGQVPDALLRHELEFRRRTAAEITRAVARGGVAIALAATGFGAWSLVWGEIAGDLCAAVVAWSLVDYRPRVRDFAVRRAEVAELWRFGAPAAANGLLSTLVLNIDYLIVGRVLGPAALGFYALAFRLPEMLVINVFQVVSAVTFPIYSRARGQLDRLRRGYVRTTGLQATYGLVAGCALALAAPALIAFVFGARWSATIVPLEALAAYAALRSLAMGAVDLFKAIGRPAVAARIALVRFVVLAPALWVAAHHGIAAVAVCQAVVAAATVALMQMVAARTLRASYREFFAAVTPGVVASAAVVAVGLPVRALVPGPPLLRLTVLLAAAAAAAAAALATTQRAFVRDTVTMLRRPGSARAA